MKKGFTLIELLAVIIIISIVSLITVPAIMNVIKDSKKGVLRDTAYGLIRIGQKQYSEGLLDGIYNGEVFEWSNSNLQSTGLEYSGSAPQNGIIKISNKGVIDIAVHDGTWCAYKKANMVEVELEKINYTACKSKL